VVTRKKVRGIEGTTTRRSKETACYTPEVQNIPIVYVFHHTAYGSPLRHSTEPIPKLRQDNGAQIMLATVFKRGRSPIVTAEGPIELESA